MHGKGTYKWLDGRMYHGEYKNDKKDGYGVYQWADGRAYIGDWVEGKQADERIYVLPNGQCRKGKWEDGSRKEWEDLKEDDAKPYKEELEKAINASKEVESKLRKYENNLNRLMQGQEELAEEHEQNRGPN